MLALRADERLLLGRWFRQCAFRWYAYSWRHCKLMQLVLLIVEILPKCHGRLVSKSTPEQLRRAGKPSSPFTSIVNGIKSKLLSQDINMLTTESDRNRPLA